MAGRVPGRAQAGFSLVELMIVVAMIGILSAIAMPAFSRYVKKSRLVEATATLEKLWVGSVAYYEADHADANMNLLPKLFPGSNGVSWEGSCCSRPNHRCPANPDVYQLPASSTLPWPALNFNIPMEHYYPPLYFSYAPGAFPTYDLWIYTNGDLDCDGVVSEIGMKAKIVNATPQRLGPNYFINELE